ncbi:MAG: isoprenylcysteine carboxylmethyltransferase family protein [Acidobacteriota bacterium]|nr:isoprenylcysteine carboxylmethyltransferase family protein [Acidobacteriota bacterium]
MTWSRIARRIRVPLSFAFAIFYSWMARPTATSILIGCFIALPGLLVRALASGHVQKNELLATSGPYAYTRNPLYLGSLTMAVGFAIAARSWWVSALMVVVFFAIYVPVILSEEAFLFERFPEFEQYSRTVPRLVPRIFSARFESQISSATFSRELYLKHREYNAAIGFVAMTAALIAKLLWLK